MTGNRTVYSKYDSRLPVLFFFQKRVTFLEGEAESLVMVTFAGTAELEAADTLTGLSMQSSRIIVHKIVIHRCFFFIDSSPFV